MSRLPTRYTVYLSRECYDTLVKLQKMSGCKSLEETITRALRVYKEPKLFPKVKTGETTAAIP